MRRRMRRGMRRVLVPIQNRPDFDATVPQKRTRRLFTEAFPIKIEMGEQVVQRKAEEFYVIVQSGSTCRGTRLAPLTPRCDWWRWHAPKRRRSWAWIECDWARLEKSTNAIEMADEAPHLLMSRPYPTSVVLSSLPDHNHVARPPDSSYFFSLLG